MTLFGGAMAGLPFAAHGQHAGKTWRIGYLGFAQASNWTSEVEALRGGLRDLGYIEGKNLTIEFRWADRADQTLDLAIQREPLYVRPTWPAAEGAQQMMLHLDFEVVDVDAAVAHALELGAELPDFQPQENVRVMLDPAGHPFCLYS